MLLLLLLFHARCSQSFQYFASRANSWPSAWAKPWCPEARPRSTLASQAGWTGVDDASTCPPAPKTGQNTSLSNMRDSQTNKLHIDVAVCDLLYQNWMIVFFVWSQWSVWIRWGRCFEIFRWDAKQDCIRRGGRLFEPRWCLIFQLCSNWKVKETKLTGLRSWMSWCTAMSPGLESAIGSESQILRQKTSMSWPIQLQCTEGIYCSGMFMHQTIRSWLTPTSGQVTQSGRGHCFREHCTQRRQAVPIKLNISAANGANGTICMKPSG